MRYRPPLGGVYRIVTASTTTLTPGGSMPKRSPNGNRGRCGSCGQPLLALPCGIRETVWFAAAASAATPRRTLCGGCKVSKFERLLVPGSTELPECRCGSEMKIIKSDAIGSDAEVRTYQCPQCEHELRLTMWGTS
jgi:hypothetical protein